MGITFFAIKAQKCIADYLCNPAKDNKALFAEDYAVQSKANLSELLKSITKISKDDFNTLFVRYENEVAWGRQLPWFCRGNSPTDTLKGMIDSVGEGPEHYGEIARYLVNYMKNPVNHGRGFCVFLGQNFTELENYSVKLESETPRATNNKVLSK